VKTVEECLSLAEQAMLGGNFRLSTFYHQRADLLTRTRGDKARVLEELRKKLSDGRAGWNDDNYPYRNVVETPTGFRVFIENTKVVFENGKVVSRHLYPAQSVIDIVQPFQRVGWDIDIKRFEYGSPGFVVCHSHHSGIDTMYRGDCQICNQCLEVLPLVLPRKPESEQDPG
jgi:hypothetical protein